MGVLDDLEDLLDPIFDGVRDLFGDDDDEMSGGELSPEQRLHRVLDGGSSGSFGQTPGPVAGQPLPGGPSGVQQGADQAGRTYQQAGGAVAVTDDKLAGLLKQVFASNDETRSRISEIISGLESTHRQLVSDPRLANDPHALAWFNQLLDKQLAQVQTLLGSAKVDGKKQAELLGALADEYHSNSGSHSKGDGKDEGNKGADGNKDAATSDESGGGGGDVGVDPGAGPGDGRRAVVALQSGLRGGVAGWTHTSSGWCFWAGP